MKQTNDEQAKDEINEIVNEVKIMEELLGAQLRLLMLEKAVLWSINRGKTIINDFDNNSKSVPRLSEIMNTLQRLVRK